MKRLFFVLSVLILFSGCNKIREKAYYDSGELMYEIFTKDEATNLYLTKAYYKNGVLSEIGYIDSTGNRVGIWKEYYSDGVLKWEGEPYYDENNKLMLMFRNTDIVPFIKYIEIEGVQILEGDVAILKLDDYYRIRIFTDSIHPDLLDIGVKYKSDSVYFWLPRNPMDSTCYPYILPISREEEIEIRCFSYDEYGDISFELPGVSWYFPVIEDPLMREDTTDISQNVINVDFK